MKSSYNILSYDKMVLVLFKRTEDLLFVLRARNQNKAFDPLNEGLFIEAFKKFLTKTALSGIIIV